MVSGSQRRPRRRARPTCCLASTVSDTTRGAAWGLGVDRRRASGASATSATSGVSAAAGSASAGPSDGTSASTGASGDGGGRCITISSSAVPGS